VLLGEAPAEQQFDHRGEPHALEPGEPGAQLGVEQSGRAHPGLPQGRQVLRGGVEDPFDVGQGGGQAREVGNGDRVDQEAADVLSAQLDEVCALTVTEAGGAFGVHGHRAGAGGKCVDGLGQGIRGHDDRRDTTAGFQQRDRRRAAVDHLTHVGPR
jgi:hypothetical protein